MAATSRRENVVSLEQVRAERRAAVPVSLEMEWDRSGADEEPWALGRTIWFAVAISAALWVVIVGVVWFV